MSMESLPPRLRSLTLGKLTTVEDLDFVTTLPALESLIVDCKVTHIDLRALACLRRTLRELRWSPTEFSVDGQRLRDLPELDQITTLVVARASPELLPVFARYPTLQHADIATEISTYTATEAMTEMSLAPLAELSEAPSRDFTYGPITRPSRYSGL